MIVCKIQMYPKGQADKAYDLACIAISNEGGNNETADYAYSVSHQINTERGTYWRGYDEFVKEHCQGFGPNLWKHGLIENFFRRDGAVKLLASVLRKAKL